MVRSWQLCVNVRLWLAVSLLGCLSSLAAQPGWAGERSNPQRSQQAR
ncbi:hypothetical protein HC931_14975 [Candidatus Gracilibacteria bacterium]|nr:hypothetical protein [Candidatus Gracilibacteria bacterium]NJM88668.1 hypothetical protein [Hydrococcus sp. RU_2_2]